MGARPPSVVALLAALALTGCGALPPSSSSVHHEVTVVNYDDATHEVSVVLRDADDETVIENASTLDPSEEWTVTSQERAGNYTLVVSVESGTSETETYRLPLAEGGRTSFTTVRVRAADDVDVTTYWQT